MVQEVMEEGSWLIMVEGRLSAREMEMIKNFFSGLGRGNGRKGSKQKLPNLWL